MVRWSTVLDEFEQRLHAVGEAAAAGNPAAVPPFVPPTGLGPMPEAVVVRARELLVASRALERRLDEARQSVASRLREIPDAPPPTRGPRLDVAM